MPDTPASDLACLDCGAVLSPSRWIRHVAVCGTCGATMALEDGELVKGTGAHADALTADELREARRLRGPFLKRRR